MSEQREVTLVYGLSTEKCISVDFKDLEQYENRDDIIPVINGDGYIKSETVSQTLPVVEVLNPKTNESIFISWSNDVEELIGVPLVEIKELRRQNELLRKEITHLKEASKENTEELLDLVDENNKLKHDIEEKSIWKIALGRASKSLGELSK